MRTKIELNKKLLAAVLALQLFWMCLPLSVTASDTDILKDLPYYSAVNHSYSYDDFANSPAIVVFGRVGERYSTSYYLTMVDNLVSHNQLEVNILFYDIENTKETVNQFFQDNNWTHIFAFNDALDEMWSLLYANGVNSSVNLPVVYYITANGQISSVQYGNLEQESLITEIRKLIGISKNSTGTISNFKVLADVTGDSFDARRKEIEKQLASISSSLNVTYGEQPSYIAPHIAGSLSNSYELNALKTINLIRYLSGLPNVKLDADYSSYAQHGAVLLRASKYGHYPEQPIDMSDSFYKIGYKGTSEGNIYWGFNNLFNGIVHGWIADEDNKNLAALGHRRWALNPRMGATGFGEYETLAAMYAIDQSVVGPDYEAIAYPSGAAFPSAFFKGDYPWHISVNPSMFEVPDKDKVTVTLSGDGKSIAFSQKDSSFLGNYFNINTEGYGISNSIVFRPVGIEYYRGTYTVQVNGLKTIMGDDVVLTYKTTFYDDSYVHPPEPQPQQPSIEEQPSPWAVEDVATAIEYGLVPSNLTSSYTSPISRAEFSQLAVLLYESMRGEIHPNYTFNDTTDLNVRKMATLGVVNGTGNGQFNPHSKLTREQAAKMLNLLIVNIGYMSAADYLISYSDDHSISDWAKPHIESISQMEIMSGVGGNRFDPMGQFTREQSIVTMLRIREFEHE